MSELHRIIRNGILEDSLDGNSQEVVNLLRLVVGGASGSAALHLSPGGTPTGASDGVWFGDDVKLYRSDTETLKLAGDSGNPDLDMSSGRIVSLGDPVGDQDAATKLWATTTFATGAHQHNASTAFSAGTVTHEYGGLEADVSAYGGVPIIESGTTSELKFNRAGTVAPGVTNDSSEGYAVLSRWADVVAGEEYVCLDATEDAAVWVRTTSIGGGGASELSDLSDVGTAPSTANFFLATADSTGGTYNGRLIVEGDLPTFSASKIGSGTLVHERGGLEADVSSYSGIPFITLGSTVELKVNFTATVAPDADNDSTEGFIVGSRWIDIVADEEYVCLNNTASSAVWKSTTEEASGGASQLAELSDVSAASQTANFFLGTPDGTTGNYIGRLLVSGDIPNLPTSKITSGTFASTRISEASVTQHEAALTILTSQLSGTVSHESGGLEANVSAYAGIPLIESGSTLELKYNRTATTDPTINDDTGDGYLVGSRWYNVTADTEWVCIDISSGAAVWKETTAGNVVPDGGTTGQLLAKASNTDLDLEWITAPQGVPSGGTTGQVLAKTSNTDYDLEWADDANTVVVPVGGTTGQVLAKTSNTDYDLEWVDDSDTVVVPSGGTTGQVLAKSSNTDYDLEWVDESGGASLPVNSTSALVQDASDNSKLSGIDVTNVPTSTRVDAQVPKSSFRAGVFPLPYLLKESGTIATSVTNVRLFIAPVPMTITMLSGSIEDSEAGDYLVNVKIKVNGVVAGSTLVIDEETSTAAYYDKQNQSVEVAAGDEISLDYNSVISDPYASELPIAPLQVWVTAYYHAEV